MAAVVRTPPTVRLALRSDRSDGMPSLVSRFGREVRAAPRPQAPTPHAELVEVAIDHRRRIQGQELAEQQPADDGNAERSPQLGAVAEAQRERYRAERSEEHTSELQSP